MGVPGDFATLFEVDRLCSWILSNKFQRTALQLPDHLLGHAFELMDAIECRLSKSSNGGKLYVLADTSYRSCCLDEIAAEHVSCDSIVHFGDACLSACSSRIPSLYIFCRHPFELEKFVEQFKDEIKQLGVDQRWDECLLLCEAGYTHIQESLEGAIARLLPSSMRLFSFKVPVQNSTSFNPPEGANTTELLVLGRKVPDGFFVRQIPEEKKRRFLVFVGSKDSPLLPIAQMTLQHIEKTVVYCPETCQFDISDTLTNRMLLRRLYLIERLRDAHTVGLVIGAVAIRGCREAVARVRKLCELSGKKLYVMYIGKLNEAKLSNFGIDVEAFVLLSCPFGIILDGTKFCRPILSVFEAEVALNPNQRKWLTNMQWTPEFEQLAKAEICRKDKVVESGAELVSLTSGKIRRCYDSEEAEVETNNDSRRTMEANKAKQLVEYSAGDHFAMRSWRGLEDKSDRKFCNSLDAADAITERQCPCELKQGMDGIATRYATEPLNSVTVQNNFVD